MKLYNLKKNKDGSVKVETELSAEDMQVLLLMGFYACVQQGLMLKSLAHHFTGGEAPVEVEIKNDFLDDSVATKTEINEITDWESALEGTIKNDDKAGS